MNGWNQPGCKSVNHNYEKMELLLLRISKATGTFFLVSNLSLVVWCSGIVANLQTPTFLARLDFMHEYFFLN